MSVRFLACLLLLVPSVAAFPADAVGPGDARDAGELGSDALVLVGSVPTRPVSPVDVSVQPPEASWDEERPLLVGVFPDARGARVEWWIGEGADPVGFRVHRSVDGAAFEAVADVGADARSWVDDGTGAPEVRRLAYRVTALYEDGAEPRESAASNEGVYVVGPWQCALVEVDRLPPALSDFRFNPRYLECMWASVFLGPPPVPLSFESG